MGIFTGDLIPRASGAASLGVEQTGLFGFSEEISPYSHIHANSGVLHGSQGSSGVFRYNNGSLELSNDGGLTFSKIFGLNDQSLQSAFDGGREIETLITSPLAKQEGILVKEQPGLDQPQFQDLLTDANSGYGVAVSGYTNTPENPNSFSFAKLFSNGLVIKSSGTQFTQAKQFFIGLSTANTAAIATSGAMTFTAIDPDASIGFTSIGNWNATAGTTMSLSAVGNLNLASQNNNISLSAALLDDVPGGQVEISAFNSSGQLRYEFGPNEAWHVSPSHTSDFFPIPHSGQVNQMILESTPEVGLQSAYGDDPTIVLNGGDLVITADSNKPVFASFETEPTLNISGIITEGAFDEIGDLNLFAHSLAGRDPHGATSLADIQAKSLGLPSIGIDTGGSGIMPLAHASGVQKFRDSGGTLITSVFTASTTISVDSTRFQNDGFYAYDSSTGGVKILVPGCYLILGNALFTSNQTTTNLLWFSITPNSGGSKSAILGSRSACPVLANGVQGLNATAIANLRTGDIVTLEGSKTAAGPTVISIGSEGTLYLMYLGPPRGGRQ